MASITAKQVKDLRDKTNAGMMDAKKALVEADGDEKRAIEILREKGVAKAAKKSGRVAAAGLTNFKIDGDNAAIVEVNAETDFVSGNDDFKKLVTSVTDVIAKEAPKSVDDAMALSVDEGTVQDKIISTTQSTGEKVTLRRFEVLKNTGNDNFGAYIHNGGEITALVQVEGADEATAKDVAMHAAAQNPEFLDRNDIPKERLEEEHSKLRKEALDEGKPEKIVDKMVEGRLNKFLAGICLADQPFVKDPDQTVQQFVESKGGKLKTFVRYEVGEGIEKEEQNFADEVNSQINK
ncbi:elongation factor Ts [Lactobacillus sp. S2-2]|uniref:translation elongation factor Ts n=1 Tax=Lactobacillus sp. S2-2 TaxID=2692917 RepID=UPI001F00554B|nr:translation elongation factor Ts [Lactobacillus sp. S2-2]MCF6514939.1 elongation factor Ts [Lactobacillus sp. S2-2]